MTATSKRQLEAGDPAPAFRLADDRGNNHELKAYRGRWVVLFFYPRDLTPGCTQEACDFRDTYARFTRRKVVVLGVSDDPAESHREFRAQHRLPFPLLVDEGGRVAGRFGAWKRKLMFGRRYMGIERSTFVIDPSGRLALVVRRVKVEGHVEQVLHELSELMK